MRLPGLDRAVVSKRKVTEYLLSQTHPSGRHKATWLTTHGFALEGWSALVEALKLHALHEVALVEQSAFGTRYLIEGPLVTPDGRAPVVRSVWFIKSGSDQPKLVTVYPLRGGAA